ncbi:MAG TPA: hypothetical protein DCK95_03360 [Anaerolineaceae bacterium]|nr:hypothetical protein [Anaerolineaceae bacterium]
MVIKSLAQASKILAETENTLQLRQIQASLEMSKEESSTIIVYPMDSLSGKDVTNSSAAIHTPK